MDGFYTRCMEQDILSAGMVLQELGHIVHLKGNKIRGKGERIRETDRSRKPNQISKPTEPKDEE